MSMKRKRSINEQPPLQTYRRKRPKKSYVHWYVFGGIVIALTLVVGSIFAMKDDSATPPKKQPASIKKTPKQEPDKQKEIVMVENEEDLSSSINEQLTDSTDKTPTPSKKDTASSKEEINQSKKSTSESVKDQKPSSSDKHFNKKPVDTGRQNGQKKEQNGSNETNGNGHNPNQNSGANHSPDPNPPSNEEPNEPPDSDHEEEQGHRGHWWDDFFDWIRR